MTAIRLGALTLDARDYASQGNAILGIRDSGKSYTATYLAERLLDAGIPFTAFDPIGLWRFLRVGAKGAGYPVVVAGGEHGDLPLTPHSAPEIVRAAMHEGVSLVLDLYSMQLSKGDWKRIVEKSVRAMLYENKAHGLRHIFIEEAAEFCPQRVGPDQGSVYAEIEKLARMGGNALLGYTLINQRAEEVNKAVLELCDGLFLHRQKGRNSLVALSKWLDVAGAKGGKDLIESLPELPQGQCWAWPAGSTTPIRLQVPAKNTYHPDRRALRDGIDGIATKKAVDVGRFVAQLSGALAKHLEEAKANDPAELRRRIGELERQLKAKGQGADPDALRRAAEIAYARGVRETQAAIARAAKSLGVSLRTLQRGVATVKDGLAVIESEAGSIGTYTGDLTAPPTASHAAPSSAVSKPPAVKPDAPPPVAPNRGAADPGRIGGPEGRILNALAELKALGVDRPERVQVAFLAGYSHLNSKGFVNGIGALRSAGLIDHGQGVVWLTEAGEGRADPANAPATSAELQERIVRLLEGATARVLKPLIDAYPEPLERDALAAAAGYGHLNSKGFVNALGRLRSLGFVDYPDRGRVVALPVRFLERR